MEQTKNQRVKIIRENLGLEQSVFCIPIGIGQGTLSNIENGRGFSDKVSKAIIKFYNVNPEYLENGILPIFIDNKPNIPVISKDEVISEPKNMSGNMYLVPIKAFGGFLTGYSNKAYLDSLEVVNFPFVRGTCYAFEIDGFSMVSEDAKEESYYPGNWVACTEIESFSWLQKGKSYVFATIDGIIVKQFIKVDESQCYLKSLNLSPEYKVNPIPLRNIKRMFYIDFKISKPS